MSAFQRKLKKVISSFLANFETIDLFLHKSTWPTVNILLYNLSKQKNVKNIIKFILKEKAYSETKIDRIKTLFCNLHSLFLGCYKIKVTSTLAGEFTGFVYAERIPGVSFRIVSPVREVVNIFDDKKENILPYPIISKNSPTSKRDMVIIFGDTSICQDFSEYLPSNKVFIEKLTAFFKSIEGKYSDCKLWYKPHPGDKNRVMSGINIKKYNLFDNTVNAQVILDTYNQKIKAVYSIISSSAILGSFFGIPSYTLYRYLFNSAGIEKFDNLFDQDNTKSKFLLHMPDLKEIGKIDNLESHDCYVDLENIDERYRKVLNV